MQPKVLVVEDEPSIADNVTYALSTEGFASLWCSTGAEALDALGSEAIGLIILDIGLPDVNGFELARQIRQSTNIPLIFVTARADEIDRVVGLELGADDYVVKPFSPRELTARVKAVLRRADRAVPPIDSEFKSHHNLSARHPFLIDTERHCISYYGTVLDLSRYEFRLLSVLVESPGRVYSRELLMQLAWDEPDASLARTVDTHIKTLRQKLRAIRPQDAPIVTHRGVGYSIEVVP